jgi:hypothetical protein
MIHTKYWAESAFRWSLLLCASVVIAELGSTTILKINKIKKNGIRYRPLRGLWHLMFGSWLSLLAG